MNVVTYKLPAFEGPLDLLLHLIEKAEVDITHIAICEITDQYLGYVAMLEQLELEVASEFLVLAATLLSIKSKMLLPKPPSILLTSEFEQDGEAMLDELVERLVEYRKYKSISDLLRDKELERSLVFSREPQDLTSYVVETPRSPVEGLAPFDLLYTFQKMLKKLANRNVVTKIRRDEISVKDCMRDVLKALSRRGGKILFSHLQDHHATRSEYVVFFLALLELMKMNKILCFQHRLFEDIVIQAKEGAKVDDTDLERMEIDH
jgi:segregation and condensation protein A